MKINLAITNRGASHFIVFLLFIFIASNQMFSQVTKWEINGNTVYSDSKLGTNTGYDLIIETNNMERMRVTDAGYIGIGMNLPEYKLDVLGDIRLNGNILFSAFEDALQTEPRLLSVDENGVLSGSSFDSFRDLIYYRDSLLSD